MITDESPFQGLTVTANMAKCALMLAAGATISELDELAERLTGKDEPDTYQALVRLVRGELSALRVRRDRH